MLAQKKESPVIIPVYRTEPTYFKAEITRIHRKKSSKNENPYITLEYLELDGQLKIIEAESEKEFVGKVLSFKMMKGELPVNVRKNTMVNIKGIIAPLSKKKQKLIISEINAFSETDVLELYREKGLNVQKFRENNYETSVKNAIKKGEITHEDSILLLQQLYSQQVAKIEEFLRDALVYVDIESIHKIISFFHLRAKRRSFRNVLDMLEKNPWFLIEMDEWNFRDVKPIVFKHSPELSKEYELYAKIVGRVKGSENSGNSYIRRTTVWSNATKEGEGLAKEAKALGIENIGRWLTQINLDTNKPFKSMGQITPCTKFKKDEINKYYGDMLDKKGQNFASALYYSRTFFCEKFAAEDFAERIGEDKLIIKNEKTSRQLDKVQKKAVQNAINHKISIITGPAGTGKTHAVGALVEILTRNGYTSRILAPSALAAAVAASKIKENTHHSTIHRAAKISPDTDDHGEKETIKPAKDVIIEKVIIVDETSMCTTNMFRHLLHAIHKNAHIVLVGDPAQVPAIGPSGFFHQLIRTKGTKLGVPVTILENVYRAENSTGLNLAHSVRKGVFSEDLIGGEVKVIERVSKEAIKKIAMSFDQQKIPLNNILFLTSKKKGAYGAKEVNKILQEVFNPKGEIIPESEMRVGDVIISERNDRAEDANGYLKSLRHLGREDAVYNGTRGIITAFDGHTVYVKYDKEKTVPYAVKELPIWVDLAYIITIHKAQGSEADHVVVINSHGQKLNRNMLYTAITRFRKELYLIGKRESWKAAAEKAVPDPLTKFVFRVDDILNDSKSIKEEKIEKKRKPLVTI